jgi:hypothetical protein
MEKLDKFTPLKKSKIFQKTFVEKMTKFVKTKKKNCHLHLHEVDGWM